MKVLLATDGSEACLRATEFAARLLGPLDEVEVTVLLVRPTGTAPVMGGGVGPVEESRLEGPLREAEHALLEQSAHTLRATGLEPDLRLEAGPPAEVISGEIDRQPYDLLIMGRGGFAELPWPLRGSVDEAVLRAVDLPVLLVR